MNSTLATVKCPKPWRFTVMEWNLIKAYLMDWNTKRYFEAGDTFVKSYVQPQVWQLLELFGDGSELLSTWRGRWNLHVPELVKKIPTPLTVGKLIHMSDQNFLRVLEEDRIYEPDIHAWTHMMCKAYDAKPEKNIYTIGRGLWGGESVLREPPTSVLSSQPSKGKVGNTPAWCNETRAEKVENEGNYTVSVTRPVEFSYLTEQFTKVNKHVLNFCPLRQEYCGQGHLHTGSFNMDVLGYGKIHNDYLENPSSVSGKKLYEMFGDQGALWKKTDLNTKHPTPLPPSCMKPWSEDVVTTVEKVDYDFMMIRLKVQKRKYLWNVEITNDGEGNTTVQAVEYPDPSTKYPNGVVMTRYFNAPIIKTEECWRVHPEPFDKSADGRLHKKGWGYSVRNITYPTELHGIEKLLAKECIRKKGQKRPATRPSWMN